MLLFRIPRRRPASGDLDFIGDSAPETRAGAKLFVIMHMRMHKNE
jgi:hypothetical protein